MAKNLYYFRSATLNKVVRGLGGSYRLIPLNRRPKDQPAWDLPAVLIADEREDDLKSLAKLAPKDDTWRMIWLLQGEKPPRTELDGHLFALLPHKTSSAVLAKTVESAFENLH